MRQSRSTRRIGQFMRQHDQAFKFGILDRGYGGHVAVLIGSPGIWGEHVGERTKPGKSMFGNAGCSPGIALRAYAKALTKQTSPSRHLEGAAFMAQCS